MMVLPLHNKHDKKEYMEMSDISYLSIQYLSVSQERFAVKVFVSFKGECNAMYRKSHVQEFTYSKISGHKAKNYLTRILITQHFNYGVHYVL